jgi:tetraacyldisaccharide-1-P 4'-kinase
MFTEKELAELAVKSKEATLITTEKDYWRNPTALKNSLPNCLVLCTQLQITNGNAVLEDALTKAINKRYQK